MWSLAGLAIQLGRAMGLHRDGTAFGLSPYETEMRRRLWWNLCVLDLRTAEDYGSDPTIMEQTYDTKMPLNVDDGDISVESKGFPEPRRDRFTEMTFCLLRYEVSSIIRRLDYVPPGDGMCHEVASTMSVEHKEALIEQMHKRLEEKYLQHCDMTVPLQWVTATVGRLVMAKLWLMVYLPLLQQPNNGGGGSRASVGLGSSMMSGSGLNSSAGTSISKTTTTTGEPSVELSQSIRDRLFVTSIEVIEYARLLETEGRTVKWGWMFRTYVPWHSVAYLLSELCLRTSGEMVDRAWCAVQGVWDDWGERENDERQGIKVGARRGMLWAPLRQLMIKAKRVRDQSRGKSVHPTMISQVIHRATSLRTGQPVSFLRPLTAIFRLAVKVSLPILVSILLPQFRLQRSWRILPLQLTLLTMMCSLPISASIHISSQQRPMILISSSSIGLIYSTITIFLHLKWILNT